MKIPDLQNIMTTDILPGCMLNNLDRLLDQKRWLAMVTRLVPVEY